MKLDNLSDLHPRYVEAFKILDSYIDDFLKGFSSGVNVPPGVRPKNVAFIGVGGSGIIGDIASAILSNSGVRSGVFKGYEINSNQWDAVFAISYSGETAETLEAVLGIVEENPRVVAITSGGRLEKVVKKIGGDVVRVRPGIQPRYALPSMLGATLGVLCSMKLIPHSITKYIENSRNFLDTIKSERKFDENPAKRAASRIHGRLPIIYAYDRVWPVGYRLKCQLNENAKMFCHIGYLPEALHNDVEGLPDDFIVVVPRIGAEHEGIRAGIDALRDNLGEDRVMELRAGGEDFIQEVFQLLMMVDYISVYLAVLRDVDPISIPRISGLRRANKYYEKVFRRVDGFIG